jgi:hypothetical protein
MENTMKLADLSPETITKIKALEYDRNIEKHDGPYDWAWSIEDDSVEFINMDGFEVLLPIEKNHYPNIKPLRVIPSADGRMLTIFFSDSTKAFAFDGVNDFLAICEKMPNENFFVATVYHEWFVIDNPLFNGD